MVAALCSRPLSQPSEVSTQLMVMLFEASSIPLLCTMPRVSALRDRRVGDPEELHSYGDTTLAKMVMGER